MRLLASAVLAFLLAGCARPLTPAQISAASADQLWSARCRLDEVGGFAPWPDRDSYRRALVTEAAAREGWPEALRARVLAEEIATAMPEAGVLWSWGVPRRRERESSPFGVVQHWTYGYADEPIFVTLIDGRVTWWSVHERTRYGAPPH